MRIFSLCCLLLLVCASVRVDAAEKPAYLLATELNAGHTSTVSVTLEVGGEWLLSDAAKLKKLPLTVNGELNYTEHLIDWSTSAAKSARSLRHYQSATATIQVDKEGMKRQLPQTSRMIVAGISNGKTTLNSTEKPLTREQFDLVNVVGNTLALNRLLPERELKEGEGWDHDAAAISALLGMDHIAVCEVRSVVIGDEHHQVQIRLAGTVHGTIDGAPTEMELRGAYLFHQKLQQITKLNLAIKEARTASPIVPGLDVVAKVSVTVRPAKATAELSAALSDLTDKTEAPLANNFRYENAKQGYRFLHNRSWYVTQEQSDLVSLGCLQDGNCTANCNITTLPARSAGRETSLDQFEQDVRSSIGDNLQTVTASTEWKTAEGHNCFGVIARGAVEEVPIEWRYYLLSSPGRPRVSLAITIEQAQIERFADADRQLVESLELLEQTEMANKQPGRAKR